MSASLRATLVAAGILLLAIVRVLVMRGRALARAILGVGAR